MAHEAHDVATLPGADDQWLRHQCHRRFIGLVFSGDGLFEDSSVLPEKLPLLVRSAGSESHSFPGTFEVDYEGLLVSTLQVTTWAIVGAATRVTAFDRDSGGVSIESVDFEKAVFCLEVGIVLVEIRKLKKKLC